MALNIGIDFGTSTIYVTRWNEKKQCAEHIPNITRDSSEKFIENIVYYESENNLILGQKAKRKGMSFPENMVLNVKRQIEHSQWTTPIKSLNRHLNASEITTDIFKFLKNRIEELHGGTEIESVVITVPFSFKDKERALIQHSAEQAGLSSIQLIEEPVSAGISYGFFHDETFATEQPQHILMFDLGGGTLDIAILKISKSEQHEFLIDILNTGGDQHLGGKDIDQIIFNELLKTLCVHSQSLSLIDYHDLFIEAKRIKENLSEMEEDEALLNLRDLKQTLEQTISVELFNQWLKNYGFIDKILATLQQTLNEIQFKPNQIDKILLVGGSSNIPLIQSEIEKFFNKNTEVLKDPSEMVGEGAGIYCGMLANHQLKYKIIDKSQSLKNNEVNHQDNALLLEILKRMDRFDQKIERLKNNQQKRLKNNQQNKPIDSTTVNSEYSSLIEQIRLLKTILGYTEFDKLEDWTNYINKNRAIPLKHISNSTLSQIRQLMTILTLKKDDLVFQDVLKKYCITSDKSDFIAKQSDIQSLENQFSGICQDIIKIQTTLENGVKVTQSENGVKISPSSMMSLSNQIPNVRLNQSDRISPTIGDVLFSLNQNYQSRHAEAIIKTYEQLNKVNFNNIATKNEYYVQLNNIATDLKNIPNLTTFNQKVSDITLKFDNLVTKQQATQIKIAVDEIKTTLIQQHQQSQSKVDQIKQQVDFSLSTSTQKLTEDISKITQSVNTNLSTLNTTLQKSASAIELEKTQGLINRDVVAPLKQLNEKLAMLENKMEYFERFFKHLDENLFQMDAKISYLIDSKTKTKEK